MRIPLDYALCNGDDEPICTDCLRRTAERPNLHWHMAPATHGDDCLFYMEPHSYRVRELPDDGC